MLFITVAFFVLCQVFTKLVLLYQVARNEEFQCVVNGGAAYVILFLKQVFVKNFRFKVVIAEVNFLQYYKAFRGFAQVFLL